MEMQILRLIIFLLGRYDRTCRRRVTMILDNLIDHAHVRELRRVINGGEDEVIAVFAYFYMATFVKTNWVIFQHNPSMIGSVHWAILIQ